MTTYRGLDAQGYQYEIDDTPTKLETDPVVHAIVNREAGRFGRLTEQDIERANIYRQVYGDPFANAVQDELNHTDETNL